MSDQFEQIINAFTIIFIVNISVNNIYEKHSKFVKTLKKY